MNMRHEFEMGQGYRPSDEQLDHLDRVASQRANQADLMRVLSLRTSDDSPWFVVRVDFGREAVVEKLLGEGDVERLLPMRMGPVRRRHHRVLEAKAEPVLTGYVLARFHFSAAAVQALMTVKHVVGLVGGLERPHRITHGEVNRFNALATGGCYDFERIREASKAVLRPGDKVRIADGPFGDFRGEIINRRSDGKGDAVVQLDVYGQSLPLVVPLALLEKL